jgi:hypothetical protein
MYSCDILISVIEIWSKKKINKKIGNAKKKIYKFSENSFLSNDYLLEIWSFWEYVFAYRGNITKLMRN